MAYNTGNPVGSRSPKDLLDNSENLDELVNSSTKESHPDRLGVDRKTWHGMETDFDAAQVARQSEFDVDQANREAEWAATLAGAGYIGTGAGGAFEDYDTDGPLTIDAFNEIFTKDGEFYRAKPGTTLPYNTTGTWATDQADFVAVGDAALRSELAAPGGGLLVRDAVSKVANLAGLSALIGLVDGQVVQVAGSGRAGSFRWVVGDFTAEAAVDTQEGVYVAGSGVPVSTGMWVRFGFDRITPEMFGVDGSASADDFAAWEGFWAFHRWSGIPGVASGRLYKFDPASNGVLRVGINDGESIDMDFNGATLQFVTLPDTPGAFWHTVLFASGGIYSDDGATVEKIHVKNVVLDGNRRGQPDPVNPYDYEQRATMKVIIEAGAGNRCKDVYFKNVTQVDPVADTLYFGPSTNVDVNGEGAINNLTIDKFHAGARTSTRAAIQMGAQCNRVNISNVTADKPTGSETNSIETEFTSIGDHECTVNMTNVFIDDIEIGGVAGKEGQLKVNLLNVHTAGFFLAVRCSVAAENSSLRLALGNTQRIKDFQCTNVKIIHALYDNGGTLDVRSLGYTTIPGGCLWQFSNVRHVLEGVPDGGAVRPLVDIPNIAVSEVDDHVFEFNGSWFDPAAPMSIDFYAGGTVRTKGCTFGGFYRGVQLGGYSSFGCKWVSDGDDFEAVTGVKFWIAGALNSEIHFGTQRTDSLAFSTAANGQNIIQSSGRKINASAPPTGGGAVGDEVVLDAATYDAAASTDPVAWRCIRSHPTAAVWAVTANKP